MNNESIQVLICNYCTVRAKAVPRVSVAQGKINYSILSQNKKKTNQIEHPQPWSLEQLPRLHPPRKVALVGPPLFNCPDLFIHFLFPLL